MKEQRILHGRGAIFHGSKCKIFKVKIQRRPSGVSEGALSYVYRGEAFENISFGW
jgi:hypothetical protein